jgi:hypothetical protein
MSVTPSFMDAIYDRAFMVGLEVMHANAKVLCLMLRKFNNVLQCCVAVEMWLPCPEEVQVRALMR